MKESYVVYSFNKENLIYIEGYPVEAWLSAQQRVKFLKNEGEDAYLVSRARFQQMVKLGHDALTPQITK